MRMTLCEVIKGNRILLKQATRGISKGKWNGLGGHVEQGECDEGCVRREVLEESGLIVKRLERHGTLRFYLMSRRKLFATVPLFSCTSFTGRIRHSDEGRLKWFRKDLVPYDAMWPDDMYWLPLLLDNTLVRFDADFIFDADMKKIEEFSVSIKD